MGATCWWWYLHSDMGILQEQHGKDTDLYRAPSIGRARQGKCACARTSRQAFRRHFTHGVKDMHLQKLRTSVSTMMMFSYIHMYCVSWRRNKPYRGKPFTRIPVQVRKRCLSYRDESSCPLVMTMGT